MAEYTDALTRHHGERVAPVSDYCQGFYDWESAIAAKVGRLKAGTEYSDAVSGSDSASFQAHIDGELEPWEAILDALHVISVPLAKSNMLGRRIYGGEELRMEMCPEHRGQWHGLAFTSPSCGCDLTGWLPA